ncbi:large ribosomal subunit protein uL4c [Rhododendron vialii]|uniref:large ribosomal subunit protein uL4c n=1 Tax=Rhododendron vialii TaxID=182163 RepID=UPI002660598D|nr:large ribosomal subunit protein uL4c [Rhododendron vialii]
MANCTASPSISCFSSPIFHTFPHQNPKPLISAFIPLKPLKTLLLSHTHTRRTSPIIRCNLPTTSTSTLPVLSLDGSTVGEATLSIKTAPPDTSRAVVHRGIITDLNNKRRGTASTLTRGEVRGGGRKPYQQKKTGRARRGSQRTPLRRGGGVIFGPKPKDWTVKINKKEKRLAISTAIASAAVNAVVVEEFGEAFAKPKTKEFIEVMRRWGIDPKEKSMFLVMERNENVVKSSRNIGTVKMLTPRTLNLFDILNADKLVFTKGAVEYLNEMYGYDYVGEGEEEEEEEEEEFDEEEEGSEGTGEENSEVAD